MELQFGLTGMFEIWDELKNPASSESMLQKTDTGFSVQLWEEGRLFQNKQVMMRIVIPFEQLITFKNFEEVISLNLSNETSSTMLVGGYNISETLVLDLSLGKSLTDSSFFIGTILSWRTKL